MGRILILEDNASMAEWLESSIRIELAALKPETEVVETESDFVLKWLPEFDRGPKARPDVIIIDIMLRWTDPDPEQPPRPPEVIEGGFTKAGLRCFGLIQQHPVLSSAQVILFTALTKKDFLSLGGNPEGVEFVQKDNWQAVITPIRAALKTVG